MADKETVEISKVQLDGILARIDELEKEKDKFDSGSFPIGEWKEIDTGSSVKIATLRRLDDRYAIDWKFDSKVWNEKERETEYFYKITWLLPNDKKEETLIKINDFAKLERVEVKLIEKDQKPVEMIQEKDKGKIYKAKVDWGNYKTSYGREVPSKVTATRTTYTVELPDKRTVKLLESRLNA